MDPALRRQMLAYYNERAGEYEEAYTLGTGTSSMTDPAVFTTEITALADVVSQFGHGHVIDVACGTGYWLPYYAARCTAVTLFDQSERMLAECEKKLGTIRKSAEVTLIRGDVFEHAFPRERYDCALVGFFLSHLTESQERRVFDALRSMLTPSGHFLILDSAWSHHRAAVNVKVGSQTRRLNDGTTFEIYKRYLDRSDVEDWAGRYGVNTHVEHFGPAFCAVSGTFRRA